MAVNITNINPDTLEIQTYSSQDVSVLSPDVISSLFDPSRGDYIEYTITTPNNSFQITDQNFLGVIVDNIAADTGVAFNANVDPERDLRNKGFNNGEYNVIYRFLRNELNSSSNERIFFIKEISGDRTELRLGVNSLSNTSLEADIATFKTTLSSTIEYFQDFYLNFGSNNLVIANNILVDTTKPKYEILINLYEPLSAQFRLKDSLWIVTQNADPLAFNVQFQPEVVVPKIIRPTLKSPNFDLPIKNRTNNSTIYTNYEQLLNVNLVSSYNQILSYLEDKSVSIGVDYTDFSNFVYFSSAETRINNFVYKVQLLEEYNKSLAIVNEANTATTSSTVILQEKISNIIKNFDGFEYYLYYSSGSNTYPKSNLTPPYNLRLWGTTLVNNWYSSSIASASIYDATNKDYLINTIPSYLTDDPQNEPYKVFIDMIGQYYDNIWIYYKDVSNRYSGDNRLEYGISKDLVADAIRSFGLKIYQNNFSTSDLFNAFTGFNSGNYLRSTTPNPLPNGGVGFDGEQILTYEYVSNESLYTPLDDVNKEMYKRIYHNLPYLLKSKGTVAGLQNIISMFGITSSILSVKEFGGEWSNSKPLTGIKDIVTDNIQILTSAQMSQSFFPIIPPNTTDGTYAFTPQFTLSNQKSVLGLGFPQRSLSPSVNTVEITFSPQNDIDNFIKSPGNLPNFDIGTYIGNPSQTFLPYYPNLQAAAASLLVNNDLKPINYIRLIKYFDNSLFNMIKDFVPARTNLKSGITIKPHLLERSKIVQPRAFLYSSIYSGSIKTGFIKGGTGGTFDDYNSLTPRLNNTQSWYQDILTPLGLTRSFHTDQAEFYNGELPYYPTEAFTADGDLNVGNPYKYAPAPVTADAPRYIVTYTYSNTTRLSTFIQNNLPSNGNISVWVRRELTGTFTGIPPAQVPIYRYTIEYIKINVNALVGGNVSELLPNLQNVTIAFNAGGGNFSYITVPVQASALSDNGHYEYATTPTLLPYIAQQPSPFPTNNNVFFFPSDPNGDPVIWDYYEYNPIINNSVADVTSVHYMDVDYGSGITVPYNFDLLISLSASKAPVQDSNYSSKAWSNIRYNGSRHSSVDFNIATVFNIAPDTNTRIPFTPGIVSGDGVIVDQNPDDENLG